MLLPRDPVDATRWTETGNRRKILDETWEPLLREALGKQLRSAVGAVGAPKESLNLLASLASQTAQVYTTPPLWTNGAATPEQASAFVNLLQKAHLPSLLQRVDYYAGGLRACLLKVLVTEDRRLALQIVPPDQVVVETLAGDPWTLTKVSQAVNWNGIAAWEIWDTRGQRTVVRGTGGTLEETTQHPIINFLPYVIFRPAYGHDTWDAWTWHRAAAASVDLAIAWTLWGHLLTDASWPQRWARDQVVQGAVVQEGGGAAFIETSPTSVIMLKTRGEYPDQGEWAAAADPESVARAITAYQDLVLGSLGFEPEDVVRTGTGSSGYAIALRDSARLREARRRSPVYADAERQLLSLCARVLVSLGLWSGPVDGWTTTHTIPPDPEQQDQVMAAEAALEKVGHGSPVDLYLATHPGFSGSRDDVLQILILRAREREALSRVTAPRVPEPPVPSSV